MLFFQFPLLDHCNATCDGNKTKAKFKTTTKCPVSKGTFLTHRTGGSGAKNMDELKNVPILHLALLQIKLNCSLLLLLVSLSLSLSFYIFKVFSCSEEEAFSSSSVVGPLKRNKQTNKCIRANPRRPKMESIRRAVHFTICGGPLQSSSGDGGRQCISWRWRQL